MGFDLNWIIYPHVICCRWGRTVTYAHYDERNNQLTEMLRSVRNYVYVILDGSHLKSTVIPAVSIPKYFSFMNEPNLKMVLLTGLDEMRLALAVSMLNDFPAPLWVEPTYEAAIQCLFKMDPSLDKVSLRPPHISPFSDTQEE